MPWLGLDGVVRTMAVINIVAGVIFAAVGAGSRETHASEEVVRQIQRFGAYAAIALFAGFSMMTLQTVFNRIGALSLGGSHFTFSMIVAVFVLCISVGSFLVSTMKRIPVGLIVGLQWLLVALLVGLYFVLPDATYWSHVVRSLFRDEAAGFLPFHVAIFLSIFLVLCIPIGISGALLPLLFHHLRDQMGELGRVAGRIYAWNTLGSLLGALLGGYALLFFFDLDQVYVIALAGLVAVAIGVHSLVGRLPAVAGIALALVSVALLSQAPRWDSNRLAAGAFRTRIPTAETHAGADTFYRARRLNHVFHTDDPISSVTVVESEQAGRHAIITNGKSDGSLGPDYPTMALAALLPSLFSDDLSRSFVIGWGTGVTIGELAALRDAEEVVVAEISPGVIEAAPIFDYGNLAASKNRKVEIIRSDAYRALLRSGGQFGVIASEPSNPWVAGVEMLFSREFLEAARSRLTPGGVYAQWFHLYETDADTVEMVFRTYNDVFDHVSVWYTYGPDIILIGHNSDEHALDVERLRERAARPDFRAGLGRARIKSFPVLLGHQLIPLDALASAGLEGPIHTLRHPRLSDLAARAFFEGGFAEPPHLPRLESARVAVRNSLVRRYREMNEAELVEVATHTCNMARTRECATWLAYLIHRFPDAAQTADLRARLQEPVEQSLELERGGLQDLVGFFEGKPVERGGALAAAKKTTELYERFFLPSAPFPRQALAAAWRSCASTPTTTADCHEEQTKVEARLGQLTGDLGLDAGS